jgi:hypothetical protein
MVVLHGNFALGYGPGTDCSKIHIFQCMLQRTDDITNEFLEPIMFVLEYPTVFNYPFTCLLLGVNKKIILYCHHHCSASINRI